MNINDGNNNFVDKCIRDERVRREYASAAVQFQLPLRFASRYCKSSTNLTTIVKASCKYKFLCHELKDLDIS